MTNLQEDAAVPDFPTSSPSAGWYPDPSDPGQERWWGGVEWTHNVRPFAVAPAAQPALADVPGGGINPFAAIDAQESRTASSMFSDPFSAQSSAQSPFGSLDSGTIATSQNPFGAPGAQNSFGASASWSDTGQRTGMRDDPRNTAATAGLVLSLVGVNVLGIIFSILGLRRARDFENDGDLPVGRKRSRWGLGLGIASFIISVAIILAYVFAYQTIYEFILQQTISSMQTQQPGSEQSDDQTSSENAEALPVLLDDGSPAVWSRAMVEQLIIDALTQVDGTAPESVRCPDEVEMVVGESYLCTFRYGGMTHTFRQAFTSQTETEVTVDGVVQE
jgi:hypothetical protein